MIKRTKLNVGIKDVRIKKIAEERGVVVLVIFDQSDLINPDKPMNKRYKITTRQWFENLKSDLSKIGISLSDKNLEKEARKAIGKSVLITYVDKGNGYSNIFFEGQGVDERYKEQSVDDVLEDIIDDAPSSSLDYFSVSHELDDEWLDDML